MKRHSPFNVRERSMDFANYVAMGIDTYKDRLLIHSSFLAAAVFMGVASVYFIKLIMYLQTVYDSLFSHDPIVMSVLTPIGFLAAAAVCKYFAPYAGGSGVPQVLHAASFTNDDNSHVVSSGLLSFSTAVIKTISTTIGFLCGASIGGEGPIVQIAGAIFATIGDRFRKYFPNIDFRSFIVAAGGAGFAAAFNTPLGGVAFAFEEVALASLGRLRHSVMLAVVVAGLTAQALIGNELYFGQLFVSHANSHLIGWALVTGIVCGGLGGLFGRIVSSRHIHNLKINWWQRALMCGIIVGLINWLLHGSTAGSGYVLTRSFMDGSTTTVPFYFPLSKVFATAFSTLSGMGGGILAPSITIGAWTGASIAKFSAVADPKVLALFGMSAYFSAAFQLPITAVIVVMEMTNQHDFIIPMMIASVTAYLVGRLLMPVSLYHVLIERSFHKKTLSD